MADNVTHGLFMVIDDLLLFCKSQISDSIDYCLWVSLMRCEVNDKLNFKVRIGGLGSYYTNGASLLQATLQSFICVETALCEESTMALVCRRIGDYSNVSLYEVLPLSGFSSLKESLSTKPIDFTGFSFEITKISYSADAIESHFSLLHQYLRTSQIINPQMTIYLDSNLPSLRPTSRSLSLDPLPWINVLSTSFKLASTLSSYIPTNDPVSTKQKKIKLYHSSPVTVSNCRLCASVAGTSIRVSCYVGVMPHFRLPKGKKIPADKVCSELKVSFYGPGNTLLFPFGSRPRLFNINQLVDWLDYNIRVIESNNNDSLDCNASFHYNLSSSHSSDGGQNKLHKRTLHIFIFIEEHFSEESKRSQFTFSPDQKWSRYSELMSSIRNNFDQFLQNINKTLQRLTRLSLNKVICNYGSSAKMNAMVSSAIPVLSNAISSIVNNSQNTSFQEICSSVLDTNCLHESETIINRKLRSLVKKELNMVTKTNGESEAKGPEEPSTPELEQAVIVEDEGSHDNTRVHGVTEQVVPSYYDNGDSIHNHNGDDNDSELDHFDSLMQFEPFSLETGNSDNLATSVTDLQRLSTTNNEVMLHHDLDITEQAVQHVSQLVDEEETGGLIDDAFDLLGEMAMEDNALIMKPKQVPSTCVPPTTSSYADQDFTYSMEDFSWD